LLKLKPKLKDIYQKYYKGKEKSFIELLELIAAHNRLAVEQAIALLEKINPTGISTEKIKTIVERNNDIPKKVAHSPDIETSSKKIVNLYAKILKEVSV
jgi:hypothetical protein